MTTPMTIAHRMSTQTATDWLCLAATPTFAIMAWISAGDLMPLCAPRPSSLPFGDMVSMYLLMGFFHLPPWLTTISRRGTATPLTNQTDGD